jgi:hypothetical protein
VHQQRQPENAAPQQQIVPKPAHRLHSFPVQLRWGSSEDAEGLSIPLAFEKNPEFCELTLEQPVGLMVELNGKWFYKAPHVKTIDLMSAFFDKPLTGAETLQLKQRLYEIEKVLPETFVKINQSCLCNIRKISKFGASLGGSLTVILKNGYKDYVSRRQIKAVKERFGLK